MAMLAPYSEKRLVGATDPASTGATVDATATGATVTGFGLYSQLTARLEVGGVSGGADTYDCKIQTQLGEDWIDLITFTQATGATDETVIVQRTEATSWSNRLRVVQTIGASATATGVRLTLVGAMGAGEATVTVGDITAVSSPVKAATGTVAGVDDSATSVTLLAANTSREGVQVDNTGSTSDLYIKYGGAASIASGGYTVKVAGGAHWEMPGPSIYTGVLHAIWSANTSGYANVTELTA